MIQVHNLTKRYALRTAIQQLNFQVNRGEIVGFLGPNGAGKSTTMKIITGLMPASEGTVQVAGFDVFESPIEVKRNIGFLPETPPVYREMTVQAYLDYAARLHQVEPSKIRSSIDQALSRTHLGDVRNRLIGNLSKGYRQRVGLAQALVHNPPVLILDEPTVGLDPKQIIEIRNLIRDLSKEHTIILSTHILPEVQAICSRVIVINKGKIAAQDTLEQLTARLQQGKIFNLKVKQTDPSAIEALRAISGVRSVYPSKTQADQIIVELSPESTDIRDRIVEIAVQHRMGVLEFFTEKLSLEDVFLQLTTTEEAP